MYEYCYWIMDFKCGGGVCTSMELSNDVHTPISLKGYLTNYGEGKMSLDYRLYVCGIRTGIIALYPTIALLSK